MSAFFNGTGRPAAPAPGPAGLHGGPTSSFADFLASYAPGLLPGAAGAAAAAAAGPAPGAVSVPGAAVPGAGSDVLRELPHATTIVAAICDHGVVLAGDRRATAGSMISKRDVEKVFRSDEYSAIGMAGVASVGLEFIRLFQVELEHYEKMEGRSLSLEGKANRLGTMIRGNIGGAMQGLVVVPIFAGYDEENDTGRIFSYDVAGGPYEEHRYHSIGSGSVFARGSLKKLYRDDMPVQDAVLACVQALYDAADDDSATGGPDITRRIFPVVATVTEDGFRKLPETEAAEYSQRVIESRMISPDGPAAPLLAGQERPGLESSAE
ncbi:MAG: proteasome subunit beta [Streptosporangiaceae bacterium]|nr:proteasome subunit beta [Streptosporangiaceae bacterium]MBV9854094.1 proteasome subunit beta [Streptosporangiaceae bacterium]